MKHARPDYQRLQDPENIIPEDEPVFLLRGQDTVAPFIVTAWAMEALEAGAENDIVSAALRQASEMIDWQDKHGKKIPDMPKERTPLSR